LLAGCRSDSLTYEPPGVSLDNTVETSLRRRRWEIRFQGDGSYERGCAALRDWAIHRGSGLSLLADGPLVVGTNVAIAAPLPVGFVEATCRVVAVIDEPGVFGFAYGTLSIHPERGEESFVLRSSPDGSVLFAVEAASEPAHPLARLAAPAANRLQDLACKRYVTAMRRASSGGA
jgi:uncharacterized protein (UPF0548 family)